MILRVLTALDRYICTDLHHNLIGEQNSDSVLCCHLLHNNDTTTTIRFSIDKEDTYKYYIFGHYPDSCQFSKNRPVYFWKHNVSEIGASYQLLTTCWFSKLVVWQVLHPMALVLYGCAGTCNKYNTIQYNTFGPNLVGFTWGRGQNPVSETLCFQKETGRFLENREDNG
jgi:hypothetical protein